MRPEPGRPPGRVRARLRGIDVRTRLTVLGVGAVSALAIIALSGSLSTHRVESWMDGYGAAGPLIFIALSALLTVCFFPGPLLAGAAGLLFGTAVGTPTAIIAATLGATMACLIGRFWAGDAIDELGGARVRSIATWVARRGFVSVLYARLAPGLPYNAVNYACGLTTIPVATFALATAIGTAPRTFAYVALGGSFGNFGSPETLIAIAVLLLMGIIGLLVVRRDLERERAAGAQRRDGDLTRAPDAADA
jgi:uncharacterized membrane protein YdjX (TVP38/TMEM64 family)